MPYYIRDPKRDRNFDNHPHVGIRVLLDSLRQPARLRKACYEAGTGLHRELQTSKPPNTTGSRLTFGPPKPTFFKKLYIETKVFPATGRVTGSGLGFNQGSVRVSASG